MPIKLSLLVSVSSTPLEMAPLPKSHVGLRHRNHLFLPMSIGSFVDQVISRLQQRVQCPSPNGSTVYVNWPFIFNSKKDNYRQLLM